MSTFKYPIEIGDPGGRRFESVKALVDTGASFTVLPGTLLRKLGVVPIETMQFELADDRIMECDVGETQVRIAGKTISTVVVFGDENMDPLVGAHTLERALLAVDPVRETLMPTRALMKTAV